MNKESERYLLSSNSSHSNGTSNNSRTVSGSNDTIIAREIFNVDESQTSNIMSRICRNSHLSYASMNKLYRKTEEIPFVVPPKKLVERIECKKEIHEPLTGFAAEQEKIRRKIRKIESPKSNRISQKDSFLRKKGPTIIQVKPKVEILEREKAMNEQKKKNPPPSVANQLEIVEKLQKDPSIGFYYLVYAVDRSSEYFTPYALKIVPYEELNEIYMTISCRGVTQYAPEDVTFTPLDKWIREYNFYEKLIKIKTFRIYPIWKAFYVWRKVIIRRKFAQVKIHMEKNLFISDPVLGNTILTLKKMCAVFLNSSFIDISVNEKNQLFMFAEAQLGKLEDLRNELDSFRNSAIHIIYDVCLQLLLQAGYTPDDSNITIEQTVYGKLGELSDVEARLPKDGILRMSYIEQAKKRKKCYRLSCFIHLFDYLQTNMMLELLLNTYREFLGILKIHTQELPGSVHLDDSTISAVFVRLRRSSNCNQYPYFTLDLSISLEKGIFLDPAEEIYLYVIKTLQIMWEENLNAVKPLLSDPVFYDFTRPIIDGKVENRLGGEPPEIEKIIEGNSLVNGLKENLLDIFRVNFDAVTRYCRRFDGIKELYVADMSLDHNVIRNNERIDLFRQWYIRYRGEIETINEIPDEQFLGIFLLRLERFKEAALQAPLGKMRIIETAMPGIGKNRVDALQTEALEAISYLESDPISTDDYVSYIKFVDKAQQKVDQMEGQLDFIKELYDTMGEFEIPIPPDDLLKYLGMGVHFTTLRVAVGKRMEDREKLITEFNLQLQKDIAELTEQVSEINEEVSEAWLIDAESNVEKCLQTLKGLSERLAICISTAEEYRTHQKGFRVEITRLETLEHVTNEVKLRILLWESVTSWADMVEDWQEADFDTLNVEEITAFTMRILKNIAQLEKGLPENNVLPKLKEDVEVVKDKLPVLGYLRNPNLRSRHWQKIEALLDFKVKPDEPLTLNFLDNLGVFAYPKELMEIAATASSEASLEAMLNKVDELWQNLEFTVLPYKDYKDVYILGSLEEVQNALDESNIAVQTIAASRHVGPIKPRVEEWNGRLDLVIKTLDAWQYCQQQWIYLEAIFSAPDIQRQLPVEAKLFIQVDKSWKEIMRNTAKMPLAMEACTQAGLLDRLIDNNRNLDQVTKCLEAYLETKRLAFPRFFFLSNDELLEILAQTKNPHAVQRHLQKCFDAIYRLEFATVALEEGAEEIPETMILTTDILAMISPEGERVALGKGLKARGNVENWLGKVEESMFVSLRRRMKAAIVDLERRGRELFLSAHPSQIVLTVSQIFWARNIHLILESGVNIENSMQSFEQKCYSDLNHLAAMVRGELPRLIRDVIINLVTVDVHARDVVTLLLENRVQSVTDFEWAKALRYYWEDEIDNCLAKMSNAEYLYGYEYLGASRRLVITPLTDKCYLCLMGALQLNLGGAPAGPAGTGKTETTKDLAKAVAVQCVVFNCSEGLDYKMMGRFFSGLATSGAWCCFDEFNRIDIEVLSVIAQQLITITNAKLARAAEFMFEGRMIKLVMSCATFITMNPGYAGRTELPDNLKALFRPFAMMVPDYKLIAEVTLYSEGFESSKALSKKMTLMYTLCSEQLSQQNHYDFGMRAVKSVLVMAGSLKRENPDRPEDVVLIKALRDSNIPKFLADDAELFRDILGDLFPGTVIPEDDYGILEKTAITVLEEAGLQPENCILKKTIELHETMLVRHGVMLVGPTGGGKTTVLRTLRDAYTRLHDEGIAVNVYQTVHMYVLNPKAVTLGELYGEVDHFTNEWRDGLIGAIIRHACSYTTEDHQWVVCDGPVDAVWIENMNTVLDDNKMLCLANSERIKFTPYVHMVFEVMDLAQASPATVSRCGMVYVDPAELKWLPYVKSWLRKIPREKISEEDCRIIVELFETYFEDGLIFFHKHCDQAIAQVDIGKANMACVIMESILMELGAIDKNAEKSRVKTFLTQCFIFSFLWAVGGNSVDASREIFEVFVKDRFDANSDARLPSADLWSLYVNVQSKRLDLWGKIMPAFAYDKDVPFFEILVPTIDTVRFSYVMQMLVERNKAVMFTGATGVGKSVITKVVLNSLRESDKWLPISLIFSAQTSSGRTQEILELKLERRKRTVLGAPIGKKVCVFVDDVNMPKLDTYGSQPPIELLRQILDFGGIYDREKLFWKDIEDVVFTVACAPPGGGRNPLTPRFIRHFAMLLVPSPSDSTLKTIFRAIIRGFLQEFVQPVTNIADKIVDATVEVYNGIAEDLLPTPEKSHYVFNLRDLSKCFQGMMQADPSVVRDPKQMLRLFCHECLRVFHDRLINAEDKNYFFKLLTSICKHTFGDEVISLSKESNEKPPVMLFGDFMSMDVSKDQRIYEEITNVAKMKSVLQDYLQDYCMATGKEMKIIFFMDAIEHVCRLARILRSERGNGFLVGVGGMGKQSLTKLASHLNGYRCYQIEVSRGYDAQTWHDDLRRFYLNPGAHAEHATFLFTDTQIVVEEFLEDINNTLNSGEVPNLYEADELENVIIATRPAAKQIGIDETDRDGIYQFFIGRVRNYLHLVICMSPVGDAFRRRCRMFPSLVNCCTIDWFTKWPDDALLSVAENIIAPIVPDDPEKLHALSSICVLMHQSVEDTTERFYREIRRRYYTTPSSYLELLKLYQITLDRKKKEIFVLRDKISNGLKKLDETNVMIGKMKDQLIVLAPKLKSSKEDVTKLVKIVATQQVECDKVRNIVAADEAVAKVKADETAILEADARKDLESTMPALLEAQRALESLNKNDINEIRVFNQPPRLVRFVMEAVNLLLGEKTDWPTAKTVLGDIHFLDRLINYPKDEINDKLLNKLQEYVEHPDFKPELVAKQSKVCKSICIWVKAINGYAKVYRVVEPKRERLQAAQNELRAIEGVLALKQQQLAEVEAKIEKLEAQYNMAVKNLNQLEEDMTLAEARLDRSGRLTSALADERIRWAELTQEFEDDILYLTGNILVAAGALAYLGAFTNVYREELCNKWLNSCKQLGIKTSKNYSLVEILVSPYEIRMWNTHGLPRDRVSTENAVFVTQASRWPLMIDPQEQANRWIRNMEQENNLRMCKMTDPNMMRIMETCVRIGTPILLEEIGEILDPSLEPILLKQLFMLGGRTLIRLGDSDIEYDENFKLYMTTKMANPHYLPEVCIKVTIVNFTVTPKGLEDQLLADVVRLEKPELERMRNELIAQINNDKAQLQSIEDKILSLLYGAGDDILDNEELVETLNDSKETSAVIATRLIETVATEEKISVAREKYRSVADRGSVLYFVVANLAEIDPMYQFSLKYFTQIFNAVIDGAEKSADLEERLKTLIREITIAIYTNVSRGLFEKHKLVFAFMLNITIFLSAQLISQDQWNFLLRGAGQIKTSKKPNYPTLTEQMWTTLNYLKQNFAKFALIVDDAFKKITLNLGYFEEEINIIPTNSARAVNDWNKKLSDMEKLMLLKSLKEERLIFAITAYVAKNMGQNFVETPMASLHLLYRDMSNKIPLIFVLTTGSDPFGAFQKFAGEMGFSNKFDSISLGQGQGPIAEKLVRQGTTQGRWIFLQNCHLATSWMISLETIVLEIAEETDGTIHSDFRLFLSSMPSVSFPVSVLQNSVKVTIEPPKGLKANIKRALFDMDEEFFEENILEENWRKMIFGVCFFHAIVQERKKFGPLGWTISYEFNDSDRECCLLNLKVFCEDGTIPWDALIYTTGEITYGGRVTDSWDLRCMRTILDIFFSPKTLATGYTYSPSGTYYCPVYESLNEYRDFIDTFPIIEDPEIFGMHENANIAYQLRESQFLINTVTDVQPKTSDVAGGQSSSDMAYELADTIIERILLKINPDFCNPQHLKRDSEGRLPSLTTVLLHEVDRYNILLSKIHISMDNLQRAIKGFVVMSDELESIFAALIKNQVPKAWSDVNVYPSLKSLGSWIRNLELRIDFIEIWLIDLQPISFWLSGLSFPQGFLTAMLQTYARKYNTPIDKLKMDFTPTSVILDQNEIEIAHREMDKEVPEVYKGLRAPDDGVYIHGLFIDAGRWDFRFMTLVDANKGEMNPPLPVIQIMPVLELPEVDARYVCPLYKTSVRAGVLSTTGHSTNFVMAILLPSAQDQSYWILKGTALLIEITD